MHHHFSDCYHSRWQHYIIISSKFSCACNAQNITIALLSPNTEYLPRRNELDVRFGKVVRVGRARSVISIDVFNMLNSNALLTVNENFASWMAPQSILNARLLKLSAQFDF